MQRSSQIVIALGKVHAHVSMLGPSKEAAAWHGGDANPLGQIECEATVVFIAKARNIHQRVVGTLRFDKVKTQCGKAAAEQCTLVLNRVPSARHSRSMAGEGPLSRHA